MRNCNKLAILALLGGLTIGFSSLAMDDKQPPPSATGRQENNLEQSKGNALRSEAMLVLPENVAIHVSDTLKAMTKEDRIKFKQDVKKQWDALSSDAKAAFKAKIDLAIAKKKMEEEERRLQRLYGIYLLGQKTVKPTR